MGIVSKIGLWLDKHFPEKVSTDEVYGKITAIELRLHEVTQLQSAIARLIGEQGFTNERLVQIEKRIETLNSENTALKAQAAMRTRVASSIPMPGR